MKWAGRFLEYLVVVLFIIFTSGYGSRNAPLATSPMSSLHTVRPDVNCGSGCLNDYTWSISTHGMLAYPNAIVGGSSLFVGGSTNNYAYYVQGTDSSGDQIQVGIDNDRLYSSCGLGLYYALWKAGTLVANQCFSVSTFDIGASVEIGFSYYVSGGGGTFFWLTNIGGSHTGHDPCNPCSYAGIAPTWTTVGFYQDVGGSWSGGNLYTAPVNVEPFTYLNGSNWFDFSTNGTLSKPAIATAMQVITSPSTVAGGQIQICARDTAGNC